MADIYVFDAKAEDFTNFGLVGALTPASCVFEEESNGMSEITLEHPLDAMGRYRALEINNLLLAEVPVRTTPEIPDDGTGFVTNVWVCSVLAGTAASRTLYKTKTGSTKIKVLPVGHEVTVVKKPSEGRWKVKSKYGSGWVNKNALSEERAVELENKSQGIEAVEPAWVVKPQVFRIYEVRKSIDSVTAMARHITYDLLYETTSYKSTESKTCKEALSGIFDNLFGRTYEETNVVGGRPVGFEAFTNLNNTYTGIEWERINAINALLDPENGLTTLFKGTLVRDNWEMYILKDPGLYRGVTVEYARNMTGIEYIEGTDEIATRIIPVGETADGKPLLYKPGDENMNVFPAPRYIDSPLINNYPVPYTMVLQCENCKVGSGGITNATQARQRMRQQVEALYAEGVDLPKIEMSVDFINLGDTEEYKQFRDMERLFLSDYVRVKHKAHGIDVTAKVVFIKWDCILGRMERMDVGSSIKTLANVPGFTPIGGGFQISGGAVDGPLILAGDPTEPLEAVTKQYVDREISKVSGGGTGGSIDYSTEEIPTGGKWIDKKPIYRRVFVGSVKSSTTADIATNIGFETVISLEGFLSYTSSAGAFIQRPLNYFNSASLHSRLYTGDGDGGKIQAYSTQAGNVLVIMEYTKIGDSPIEDADGYANFFDSNDNAVIDADGYVFRVVDPESNPDYVEGYARLVDSTGDNFNDSENNRFLTGV